MDDIWKIDGELQKLMDTADAERVERREASAQLTLGELILALEAIEDKELLVSFDDGKHCPISVDSWRGSYAELALGYSHRDNRVTLETLLKMLHEAVGKTYMGYKGGEFLMGEDTPVWVAEYGYCAGFNRNEAGDEQAVTGVVTKGEEVFIKTTLMPY